MLTRILSLLLLPSVLMAGNWYVRPVAQGAKTGTSWSSAWGMAELNDGWDNVEPGDTVWLAGGTYTEKITPGASGTSGAWIHVQRPLATDAIPTAAAGWSPSFDSQVVINTAGVPTIEVHWYGACNYVMFDGRTTNGIKGHMDNTITGNTYPGFFKSTEIAIHDVVITNCEAAGPLPEAVAHSNTYGRYATAFYLDNADNVTIACCTIHGYANAVKPFGTDKLTFDHCFIYDIKHLTGNVDGQWSPDPPHPNLVEAGTSSGCNFIFRFNVISNWDNEGFVGGFYDGPCYVYGNVFDQTGNDGYDRLIETYPEGDKYPTLKPFDLHFYNNTCINVSYSVFVLSGTTYGTSGFASSAGISNNVYYNCSSTAAPFQDYEWSTTAVNGSHSIQSSSDPFEGASKGNLLPVCAIGAENLRGKGIAIAAVSGHTFNLDRNGTTRGRDTGWDIGAFEFAVDSVGPLLTFDAVNGSICSPFEVVAAAVPYISQQSATTLSTGGRAEYLFFSTKQSGAGGSYLAALVDCADQSSNSWYVNVDAEPTEAMLWSAVPTGSGGFTQQNVCDANGNIRTFHLAFGYHTLVVIGKDANAKISRFGWSPRPVSGAHPNPGAKNLLMQ